MLYSRAAIAVRTKTTNFNNVLDSTDTNAQRAFDKLDNAHSVTELRSVLDTIYVNITGDTMTGALTISPSGDTSLTADKDIVLKAGRKLVFDG